MEESISLNLTRLVLKLVLIVLPATLILLVGGWIIGAAQTASWQTLAYLTGVSRGVPGSGRIILTHLGRDFAFEVDLPMADRLPSAATVVLLDWSPDGRRLAAASYTSEYVWLTTFSVDGREMNTILQMPRDLLRVISTVRWSPDGESLVYSRTSADEARLRELDLVDARTMDAASTPRQLMSYYVPVGSWGYDAASAVVAWMPDSQHVLVAASASRQAIVDPLFYNTDLFLVSATSERDPSRISTGLKNILMPVPSPDGTQIAFLSNPGRDLLALYVIKTDGTGLRFLDRLTQETVPAWSADGQSIGYWLREGSQSVFYELTLATGERSVRYTLPDAIYGARWRPAG